MIDGIFRTGLQGIIAGTAKAADDAARVVKAFQPLPEGTGIPDSSSTAVPLVVDDPVEPLIALKQDVLQVKASVKIVQVADELSKTILKIA